MNTLQEYLLIVLKSRNIRSDDEHTPTVKVDVDQDLCLEYKCARLLVQGITYPHHPIVMAPANTLIPVCVLLAGAVLHSVSALGYPSQGQQQDLGQDLGQGQGQGQGGGRQGGLGRQGSFGGSAGGFQSGAAEGRQNGGSQYGGQPGGEDASRYNFRIYTEPEYYGYESKFPGGKAMFKSYRSASRSSEPGTGRQGPQSEYGTRGLNAKSQDNFGSPGGQQPLY